MSDIVIRTEDYYVCERCEKDSLGQGMCPCPRGFCEAVIGGTITTTINKTLTEEQIKRNAEGW